VLVVTLPVEAVVGGLVVFAVGASVRLVVLAVRRRRGPGSVRPGEGTDTAE
jgi:APA family basic amino acid/polyamine antiporter